MSIIELDKVVKTYRNERTATSVHAVRGVSFNIEEGAFAALVGPSGSGKSTILNLLGCLDVPCEGRIKIDEEDIHKKLPGEQAWMRREKIGFIFQSYNLIPVLSASENIALSLSLLNLPPAEIRELVEKSLLEVGLQDMADRRPNELSGGQQQRVAIARALAKSPRIVLADEPTANLDSITAREVLDIMAELNERLNATFLFSTHDAMVMDFARRIITLHDGQVQSDTQKV